MDDLTVREFLSQIGPEFTAFADVFLQHKFTNIASLRCMKIPQDLDYIFGNTLSLGEKRQIESALYELKNIAKNDIGNKMPVDTAKTEATTNDAALKKISENINDNITKNKMQLTELEKKLQYMDFPIEEPPAQGNYRHSRCTNCHIKGHKADNNKGNNVCPNEKCTSYLLCGQKEKHKDFRDERKQIQVKIRSLRLELDDLTNQKTSALEFEQRNDASFIKIVKDRLRKSNPSKYISCSVLMRDLVALKSSYGNKIPPVSQNDKTEFPKRIAEMEGIKKEVLERELSSDSDTDGAPPVKKCCQVPPQYSSNQANYIQPSQPTIQPNFSVFNPYMQSNIPVMFPSTQFDTVNQFMPSPYNFGFIAQIPQQQQQQQQQHFMHCQLPPTLSQFTPSFRQQSPGNDNMGEQEGDQKAKIWSPYL